MAKRLGIFFLICSAAPLVVTAYCLLFTTFMGYDDEGYVLISLKNYSTQGGLYGQVFSQYGPFLYFLHDLGHRLLRYEFTNTAGRIITLALWLVVAGSSAVLVWRKTRAFTLTGFTFWMTFFHLRLMVSEPIHPGGLIAALLAIGAWWGTELSGPRNIRYLAIATGLIGAALILTKINVGIFFLVSAGAWFAIQLRSLHHARWTVAAISILIILLPVVLMRAQWSERPGRIFIILSVTASVTMLMSGWHDRQSLTTWRHAAWSGLAFLSLGLIVLGTVCLRGTALHELFDGILLAPLRQPEVYYLPPAWKPGAIFVGSISILLALAVWKGRGLWLSWLLVGVRTILVLALCFSCMGWIFFSNLSLTMSYIVPLAWVFSLQLCPIDNAKNQPNPASWIGLLLVLQYLHAYPVAGTQIAWGTFLIIPLMALGLYDAQRFIASRHSTIIPSFINLAGALLAIGAVGQLSFLGWHNYTYSHPLRLKGAENVRLPEHFTSALRIMSLNAVAHSDLLFSQPGMYSFNLWTDLPSPTLANTTHWFSLLNRSQQQGIATTLTKARDPTLIVQRYVLDFLEKTNAPIISPLNDYLKENFEFSFGVDRYEFWIRRGRRIARLGTAELLTLETPPPGIAPGKLELTLSIPANGKIDSVEVVTLTEFPQVVGRWKKTSGPLWSTSLNLRGEAVAEQIPAWNQVLSPIVRLSLPLNPMRNFDQDHVIIYVRAADGTLLAEARFTD